MRMTKKITSIVLAVMMVVSMMSVMAVTANAAVGDYIAEEDYLTFTSQQDESYVMIWSVLSGSDYKYNKNGDGWHDYNPDDYEKIYLNKGEYVRFRGSNTISDYSRGSFSISGKVAASGNIMSLRLDSNSRSQGLTYECFHNLFDNCQGLITAPELPETTLAEKCYRGMFYRCKNLTTAPALPATTLAPACYHGMFDGCTSLTEAPELPATSLTTNCYTRMFADCTSLTEPPKLPAKTLTQYCYFCMFYGCSSIRISDVADTINGIKYSEEYRIPTVGTATNASYAVDGMFNATGGKIKGTPSLNTTYYIGKPVYTVTWKNGDTTLETDTDVESGATPSYNGTTPEKAEDETNTYTFSGWSDGTTTYGLSDTLPNVTADVTYTAQFTATPKHTHVMTAHEAVAATCTTAGTSAYWECTGCGKFFSDEDGNSEIDDIDAWLAEGGAGYVAALGHNKTHYPAVAATFDAPGNIEYWYCDRCEKYFSDENCENEITQAQTIIPQKVAVAQIGSTKYESITDAIAAAADGDTITVIADTDVAYASIANKSIIIDAAGYTVTGGQYYGMSVPMFVVKSSGGLTLAGGIFTNAGDSVVNNNGTLVVDGATLNGDAFGIYNGGNLTISSGSVSGNQNSVNNAKANATTTITGGSFTGKLQNTAGEIAVSGGTFDTDVDIYAAPGYVGKQLSATTFGVEVDTNPLGLAPIIGFQKKAATGNLSGNDIDTQGVRIVTKVEGCDLTQFEEYGYVVAKVSSKQQATANFNNLKAYGGNGEKTIKCNGTVNTIDGYGTPYVTLAVNGMNDGDQVAARFYAIKDGVTYYSNYVSTARYNGIIATY